MSEFTPAASLQEAKQRRTELVAEKARVVQAIQKWSGRSRAEAVARDKAIEGELAFLRGEIQRLAVLEKHDMDKFEVVTDGVERMRALKAAMGEVWDYVKFLEREVAELRAENERLKAAGGDQEAPIEF